MQSALTQLTDRATWGVLRSLCLVLGALCATGHASNASAQLTMGLSEGEDQAPQERLRSALWAHLGVSAGRLEMTSSQVALKARVDALPTFVIGADLWTTEQFGLMARAELGLGAQLDLPMLEGDQTFSFNQQHALAGARYRWHLSEQRYAPSFELGLGARLQRESVPPQRPTYFTERLTLGPALLISAALPVSPSVLITTLGALSQPLIVREDPADSGELEGGYTLSGQLQLAYLFTETWGVNAQLDYTLDAAHYRGFGTRGLGVINAETHQTNWGISLGVRVSVK